MTGEGNDNPDSGQTGSSDSGEASVQDTGTAQNSGSESTAGGQNGGNGGGEETSQSLSDAGDDADQSFSAGQPGDSTQGCGSKSVGASQPGDPNPKTFIEIELVDEDGNAVAGEFYEITLPDGSVADGQLDDNGRARVDGIDPGSCQITFPDLDKDAWNSA